MTEVFHSIVWGKTLLLRTGTVGDVDQAVDYWTKSPVEHWSNLGVDTRKIGDRENLRTWFLDGIPRRDDLVLWYFAWGGETFGYLMVNNIIPGESANFHFHLFKRDMRLKALVRKNAIPVLKMIFSKLNLRVLKFTPSSSNIPVVALAKRLGLRFERTFVGAPAPVSLVGQRSVFSLERSTLL